MIGEINKYLDFNFLFDKAVEDWPDVISLSLEWDHESESKYSVTGLYDLCESVSDKYMGMEDEILMSNLHSSIYESIHDFSKFYVKVSVSNIRKEYIRKLFNRRLIHAVNNKDCGWDESDCNLVEDYFSCNK